MKIKNKLRIDNKTILALDGDVLEKNADFVLIDGKKYRYDIAYDMPSTIGVDIEEVKSDEIEFV